MEVARLKSAIEMVEDGKRFLFQIENIESDAGLNEYRISNNKCSFLFM